MRAYARAEWDPLKKVALHKPGLEVFFGLLEPEKSLFKRRFDFVKARKEYEELIDALKSEGVTTFRVLRSIIRRALKDEKFYEKLKRVVGVNADPWFLAKLLVLRPKFISTNGEVRVELVNPLSNLYFMRDQQITTKNGVVIGRMAKPQRSAETELVKLFWESISVKYGEVKEGYLEGGDFYPMGDFYLVGVGNRSDMNGVKELINSGEEVVIVKEPISTEFFHLDTYFNVISRELVVGVKELMQHSTVEVYSEGKLVRRGLDMLTYLKEKEFNIHYVNLDEAKKFAINFLTLNAGKILTPYDLKISGVDSVVINVENLTGGFGGIHCMSAVIERGLG
ncbi:MAG: arginine deiminase family protein [Sulfolobaceae archaeon]